MIKMRRKLTIGLLIVLFLTSVEGVGQRVPYKGQDKKDYELARALLQYGSYEEDFAEALETFKRLQSIDTAYHPISYDLGLCYYRLRGHDAEAEKWLSVAREAEITEAYFYLARLYHQTYRFEESIKLFRYYKLKEDHALANDVIDRAIQEVQRAKESVEYPVEVNIINLGPSINSQYQDYVPVVSADGQHLYFTSRRPETTGGEKDPNGEYYEDIYTSTKANGKWGKALSVGAPLNSELHDATVNLSADGNALLIFRTNENLTGGDLYLSELGEIDNWKTPVKLGTNVNTSYQEPSACLSADGNTLLFSSNRPDGYGGKDLYYCKKLPTGNWGLPRNCGPNINTEFDEDAPFLTPDSKRLYFASNGHSTIGGYDIFFTDKDDKGVWTFAENMGYPINTVHDDLFFSLAAEGRSGYYSSEKEGGFGMQDIYEVELLYDNPMPTIVKGFVNDESGKPVRAKITLMDEEEKVVHGIYNSNASNGKYLMIIEPSTRYQMVVEAQGYQPFVDYIEFEVDGPLEEVAQKIMLQKEEEEEW